MAFAQKAKKGTVLVPIKIRAVPLSDSYAQFTMLPDQSRPVDDPSWGSRDMAYTNIAEGIKKLAVAMKSEKEKEIPEYPDPIPEPVVPPSPEVPQPDDPLAPQPVASGKSYTKLILGAIGVVILALAIWLVPPMLKDDDKIAYDEARASDTVSSYESYIAKFPEGNYVTEANRFIEELKIKAADEADEEAWASAQEEDDITAYNIYLRNFPEGGYTEEANDRVTALSTAEADFNAYNMAANANNVNAYLQYTQSYPSGRHFNEAIDGIKELLKNKGWAYYGNIEDSGTIDSDRFFNQIFGEENAKPEVGDLIIVKRDVSIRNRPGLHLPPSTAIKKDVIAEILSISMVGSTGISVLIEY